MISKLINRQRVIAVAFLVAVLFSTTIRANTQALPYAFGGKAKAGYAQVSVPARKWSTSRFTSIYWTYTEVPGNYYIWFKTIDQNGKSSPQYKYPYLSSFGYLTDNTYALDHKLFAGREYFYDPEVYIGGTWNP